MPFTILVPAVFSVNTWQEEPISLSKTLSEGDGVERPSLTTIRSEQTFGGVRNHADPGISGSALSVLVWTHPSGPSPSTFSGQTLFTGTIHRHEGTLTLATYGEYRPSASGGSLNLTWKVIGSSGRLLGVTGDGGFDTLLLAPPDAPRTKDVDGAREGVRWADVEDERKRVQQLEVSLELKFPGH